MLNSVRRVGRVFSNDARLDDESTQQVEEVNGAFSVRQPTVRLIRMSPDDLNALISSPSPQIILPRRNDSPLSESFSSILQEANGAREIVNSVRRADRVLSTDAQIENVSTQQNDGLSIPDTSFSQLQPTVLLNRMSEEELNRFAFREESSNDELSEISSQQSVTTNPSQGQLLRFVRYEFMNVFRGSNRLLFVHDIEQFYYSRYNRSVGSVYACRRKTCKAKVLIDADDNILLMQGMKSECMQNDILRVDRMRSVYDRFITM